MAVVSVRLNEEEERILNYLTEYFHEDKSALFKKSLYELYEDIQDIKFIENYIEENKGSSKKYISSTELLD